MNNAEKFDYLVSFYKELSFDIDKKEGSLTISNQEQLDKINHIIENNDEYGIDILPSQARLLAIGKVVTFQVSDPKLGIGIIAWSMDHLLLAPAFCHKVGKRYFYIPNKFSYNDINPPKEIHNYNVALTLINLLKESAIYLDDVKDELVFVDTGRFDIKIKYSYSDISKISENKILLKLLNDFEDDLHKKQKLIILGKSVYSLCHNVNSDVRFVHLVKNIGELYNKFCQDFNLYMNNFSYEKIINQLETSKIDEMAKIHKIFTDIQNQMLGIPVATIIVATQMKLVDKIDSSFWVNSAVLFGCWVFFILFTFLLINQLTTLSVLKAEINRKKSIILKDYSQTGMVKKIEKIFVNPLKKRLFWQRIALYLVFLILIIGIIISTISYFVLTIPAQKYAPNIFLDIFSYCQSLFQ